jgi:hypothetical protein
VVREKPYLTVDSHGAYQVVRPSLRSNASGISWPNGASTVVPISQFYIAHAADTADTINAELVKGANLILTPGIYHLSKPLNLPYPDRTVLGLGLATLIPDQGTEAMTVADADGVSIAGVLFDAGPTESSALLHLGAGAGGPSHAANPTALFDLACRVGGAGAGKATACFTIDSNDVLIDNIWLWRADHGTGVGWTTNPAKNGIVVNGDRVTAYGLFVEHFEQYQTLWNGEDGRVYFYQSEIPYDVPAQQAQWAHDGENGWASYKVASTVTRHAAQGLGIYCVFTNSVVLDSAIETPTGTGISFQHMVTEWLGQAAGSTITHVINTTGAAVNNTNMQAQVTSL